MYLSMYVPISKCISICKSIYIYIHIYTYIYISIYIYLYLYIYIYFYLYTYLYIYLYQYLYLGLDLYLHYNPFLYISCRFLATEHCGVGRLRKEYDPLTDQGVHLNFWDGRCEAHQIWCKQWIGLREDTRHPLFSPSWRVWSGAAFGVPSALGCFGWVPGSRTFGKVPVSCGAGALQGWFREVPQMVDFVVVKRNQQVHLRCAKTIFFARCAHIHRLHQVAKLNRAPFHYPEIYCIWRFPKMGGYPQFIHCTIVLFGPGTFFCRSGTTWVFGLNFTIIQSCERR